MSGHLTIENVKREIEGIMQNVSASTSDWKAAATEIEVLCLRTGLAYKESARGRNTGVHPMNRFGVGFEAADVHRLLAKMVADGFHALDAVQGRAFEKSGDPEKT